MLMQWRSFHTIPRKSCETSAYETDPEHQCSKKFSDSKLEAMHFQSSRFLNQDYFDGRLSFSGWFIIMPEESVNSLVV